MKRTYALLAIAVTAIACGDTGEADRSTSEMRACPADQAVASASASAAKPVSFTKEVVPILTATCTFAACHGIDTDARGLYLPKDAAQMHEELVDKPAKLRVGRRYVVPGKPDESWLMTKLGDLACESSCSDGSCGLRMPKGGDPLSDAQIATLERWIAEGAKKD